MTIYHRECIICGEEFYTELHSKKACSKECARLKRNQRDRKKYLAKLIFYPRVCTVCGKEFETSNMHIRTCSKECVIKKYSCKFRRKTLEKRICVTCKCEFETTNKNQINCSKPCMIAYKKRDHSERVNSSKKILNHETNGMTMVDAICPGCGKRHKKKVLINSVGIVTPRYYCPDFPSCMQGDIHNYYERTFQDVWQTENRSLA